MKVTEACTRCVRCSTGTLDHNDARKDGVRRGRSTVGSVRFDRLGQLNARASPLFS